MAQDLQQRLLRLKGKMDLLIEQGVLLRKQKQEADIRARQLQEIVDRQRREIESLKMQLEYMQIASSFAPSREQVEQSRAILSGLVRDIDKCINDLKQ
ncbi:MAG: hypothetical protein UH625_10055 [Muribaculaceae bacterium]|nr:hypothetical protein [Muribaculaceae bacterium]